MSDPTWRKTAGRVLALVVAVALLSTGTVAATPGDTATDTSTTADGASVQEGELVCDFTGSAPVNCVFVGAGASVDTDEGTADSRAAVVVFDDNGQQSEGVATEASVDGGGADTETCALVRGTTFCVS